MEYISSVQNPRVKAWKKLHKKKERDRSGLFIIEGRHLVEEALKAGLNVKDLIIEEGVELSKEWDVCDVLRVEVPERVMKEICETETPQGIAAICELPDRQNILFEKGKFLLIDNVQDPGNIGTMVRTADAAGLDGIILGEGCADPFSGKVLRATQGSLFHISVQKMDLHEAIERCKENGVPVFGTSLHGSTFNAIAPQENFALLLGNEGSGVDPTLLKQTDQNLYIPIHGEAESLNVGVAAGILMYHLRGD
ncbi:RNA methyltransferase [Paenalkalicoccus suaedae]|uniref:RNA methyltransferase n=1 Tax=Paenalkalicoccus suaedae TaxID=2592382 RepID=A0A859FH61_9BACI|nr:RNA methyltransferase [Paenalkalicoccus suaedae]QKS72004.1 RNA methyltransferase [Paenalkalicoccus suaedae]